MKRPFASVVVLATVLLAGAAHASSIAKKTTVTLDRSATVGGSVLAAGTYRIDLFAGPATARFVKGKHTVAEAPYTVGLARVPYPGDAVHYRTVDGGETRLTKIVFASSGLVIDFPTDPVRGPDEPIAKSAERP